MLRTKSRGGGLRRSNACWGILRNRKNRSPSFSVCTHRLQGARSRPAQNYFLRTKLPVRRSIHLPNPESSLLFDREDNHRKAIQADFVVSNGGFLRRIEARCLINVFQLP